MGFRQLDTRGKRMGSTDNRNARRWDVLPLWNKATLNILDAVSAAEVISMICQGHGGNWNSLSANGLFLQSSNEAMCQCGRYQIGEEEGVVKCALSGEDKGAGKSGGLSDGHESANISLARVGSHGGSHEQEMHTLVFRLFQ